VKNTEEEKKKDQERRKIVNDNATNHHHHHLAVKELAHIIKETTNKEIHKPWDYSEC
jgi:hypothetical protein